MACFSPSPRRDARPPAEQGRRVIFRLFRSHPDARDPDRPRGLRLSAGGLRNFAPLRTRPRTLPAARPTTSSRPGSGSRSASGRMTQREQVCMSAQTTQTRPPLTYRSSEPRPNWSTPDWSTPHSPAEAPGMPPRRPRGRGRTICRPGPRIAPRARQGHSARSRPDQPSAAAP